MTNDYPPFSLAFTATNRMIARYAQQRGFQSAGTYPPDELAYLRARVQAETASRELLQAVIEPRATPNGAALGAQIKALMTLVQMIVQHSTLSGDDTPQVTVSYRYVDVSPIPARLLRDGALLLVLCALDDGALDIRVTVDRTETAVRVLVRSDSPGLGSLRDQIPEGRDLRDRLETIQGGFAWESRESLGEDRGWGDDGCMERVWDVSLTIPAEPSARVVSHGDAQ